MDHNSSRLMYSASWPTRFRRQGSSQQLGRHTDPIIYRSDGRTTASKRSSEDRLEESSKRRRLCQSPKGGFSWTVSGSDNTVSREYQSVSGHNEEDVLGTVQPKARSGRTPSPAKAHRGSSLEDFWTSACTTIDTSKMEEQRSKKRKSEDTHGARKRSRKTPSPSEGPSWQNTPQAPSSDQPGTSSSRDSFPRHSKAAFKAKYEEDLNDILGEGGFGVIKAGHRKEDNLPVAIKHLPQYRFYRISTFVDGKLQNNVPLEVALLLKLKPEAGETSAVAALLDWYDLDHELILVLERPVPCKDLVDYVSSRRTPLSEEEAKNITKQLVDGLIEIHSKDVFHRDIKLDNILIETDSDMPRIWIIDFGCGAFLSDRAYTEKQGTFNYTSPELYVNGWYEAEPTTVWQLGVVLFAMLHKLFPFVTTIEITDDTPDISRHLSLDCQDFIQRCLDKSPEARPTLEKLKNHQWLKLSRVDLPGLQMVFPGSRIYR